ncbi:hypothetical protein E2P81_ATG10795 [Venturia nashicola]|nr:hypothetical protein E2P81_ATG10795 [Venturia nashicola]
MYQQVVASQNHYRFLIGESGPFLHAMMAASLRIFHSPRVDAFKGWLLSFISDQITTETVPLLASSLAGVGVKDCDYNSLRGFNMNILEIQSINSITSKLRWK